MFRIILASIAALMLTTPAVAGDAFNDARYYLQIKQNDAALKLIDAGQLDVNTQNDEGYSLLHYAAEAGNLEMVKALLSRGADPSLKARTGSTPYQMAVGTMVKAEIRKAMTGGIAPVLAATGGAVSTKFGKPSAGGNGMCAMVRAEQVNNDRSPAMRPFLKAKDAIWYNHPDDLIGLIEDCVDVNQADQYGYTLLHQAADRDRVALAKILLEHGASKSIRNKDGATAAQLATSPEMKALLGAAPPAAKKPTPQGQAGNKVECQQKYRADTALSSDSTGKARAYRRWQQCLKTGLYW